MNTERLQILADHLEELDAVPPKERTRRFDMGLWFCDTAACALGEATTIPVFQEAGLELRQQYASVPVYAGARGLSAAELFFDISPAHAKAIFLPRSYARRITPRMVANRIRKIMADSFA